MTFGQPHFTNGKRDSVDRVTCSSPHNDFEETVTEMDELGEHFLHLTFKSYFEEWRQMGACGPQ